MTTWILVILLGAGTNAGQHITVSGLPSYSECARVSKEIMSMPRMDNYFEPALKCIEVKSK